MFDIALYTILIQYATVKINSNIVMSAKISIDWDVFSTFIHETMTNNKQLKLTVISINLINQAQKQEKLEKDNLIKLLVILAGIKGAQVNLSHEKFKGILADLKAGSADVLKRMSVE